MSESFLKWWNSLSAGDIDCPPHRWAEMAWDACERHMKELMECGHPLANRVWRDVMDRPDHPNEGAGLVPRPFCLTCEAIAKARADTDNEVYAYQRDLDLAAAIKRLQKALR